jgi:hypothetical protein
MAKKNEPKEESPDSALVAAAKTIGSTAGKIAAAVGVTVKERNTTAPAKLKAKQLVKKNKSRLPRREKKAANKVHYSKS